MTNDLQPSGSLQFFWSLSCPLEEYWVSSVEPLLGKLILFKTEEKVFSAFFFKVPFLVVGLILPTGCWPIFPTSSYFLQRFKLYTKRQLDIWTLGNRTPDNWSSVITDLFYLWTFDNWTFGQVNLNSDVKKFSCPGVQLKRVQLSERSVVKSSVVISSVTKSSGVISLVVRSSGVKSSVTKSSVVKSSVGHCLQLKIRKLNSRTTELFDIWI